LICLFIVILRNKKKDEQAVDATGGNFQSNYDQEEGETLYGDHWNSGPSGGESWLAAENAGGNAAWETTTSSWDDVANDS